MDPNKLTLISRHTEQYVQTIVLNQIPSILFYLYPFSFIVIIL
jgi:hypothetical protein